MALAVVTAATEIKAGHLNWSGREKTMVEAKESSSNIF